MTEMRNTAERNDLLRSQYTFAHTGFRAFTPVVRIHLCVTTVFRSNAEYPDGNWETRSRIWKFHQDFFRDLTHFLRTDSVVPEALKELALRASFQRGIFDDTQGWPHQLYEREARRIVSDYVITQKDLEGKTDPERSTGLASYGVDDW